MKLDSFKLFGIDIQNDFITGSLAVPGAPQDVRNITQLADQLGQQFRDSWMYRWAEGNTEKKITFVVIATLADQQLLPVLNDAVKRSVPLHRGGAWTRTHVSDCKVLDLARWSRLYAQFPVRRLSAQGATP